MVKVVDDNKKIIQILDIQKGCRGAFTPAGKIEDLSLEVITKNKSAWKYSTSLSCAEQDYTFLYLLKKDENLEDFCENKENYKMYDKLINSQMRAAVTAQIDLSEACLFDAMPEYQILGWLQSRQSALENISKLLKKPEDYEILHKAHVLTTEISSRPINFDRAIGKVRYNIFGSATGRLTTKKGSVPVMTMKKEQREKLVPRNDAFVELDLNAAEIRMLLALSGKNQPVEDIHDWTSREVFSSKLKREEVKLKTFAWLYNFSAPKSELDKFFSRQIFRDFFNYETEILKTPFGRNLKVDERRAQNYLLQSATSDQVIENAYYIEKMLKNKKSSIAFTLHDSIVIDMSREDAQMLKDIKSQFEETRWGPFKSTCKIGKSFGTLKELEI